MKTVTAAQAIVSGIEAEGIDHVFCVPGESYLPVLDALYDAASINVISARHEGGAAFMAEGYAKASGKPGVVLATRGVGAANLSIGVHTAYQDSTPMVVLLGQVHSGFRGREGFQEVDLEQFFQPISKWAVEVTRAERMPEIIQRAFWIAQTGRPGPVVVSLPEDVLPIEIPAPLFQPVVKPAPAPGQSEIKRVEALLQKSKRPVIIAGGGVKSAQAEKALKAFVDETRIPVLVAFRRHDVYPNDQPYYVGHLGLGTHQAIKDTVRQADTVLAIGTRLSEVTTQDYNLLTADQQLIHIDIDDDVLGKCFHPHIGIVASADEALKALQHIDCPTHAWEKWAAYRRTMYEQTLTLNDDDRSTDMMSAVIDALQRQLPTDAVLTNDAGNFAGWLHAFYQFTEPHTYVGPTSGAMGYGLPAAIGVKFAHPNKTVVSLSGDGGFMMTANELETAVRYGVPVISIVVNNRSYGTIRMHQEMHYPARVIATDLGHISFADLAKSVGAQGTTVDSADAFSDALAWALRESGPVVIEVITDVEQISLRSTISQIRSQSLSDKL